MDIVERLLEEENRHTIGYPGPRRNVASLLSDARDTITRLTRERDEARAKTIEDCAKVAQKVFVDAARSEREDFRLGAHAGRTAAAAAIRKLGETK